MSKAVLISIQPKWCEKIANGEKTVEVRKTKPKLEVPFKCYIYCTLPPQTELFTHGCIREYANELIRLQSGEIVYGYGRQLCCDTEHRPYSRDNFLCQKVIGEFVCDRILDCRDIPIEPTCLTVDEWLKYTDGHKGPVYGWHISNLQIYDYPKELSEFMKPCENDLYCEECAMYSEFSEQCGNKALKLTRPPQSWCYVEELLEGGKNDG